MKSLLIWVFTVPVVSPQSVFSSPGQAEIRPPPVIQRSGLSYQTVMLSVGRVLLPALLGAPMPRVLSDLPDLLPLHLANQQPRQVGKTQGTKAVPPVWPISHTKCQSFHFERTSNYFSSVCLTAISQNDPSANSFTAFLFFKNLTFPLPRFF